MLVKLIKKGAEADIYTGMWNNSNLFLKLEKLKIIEILYLIQKFVNNVQLKNHKYFLK